MTPAVVFFGTPEFAVPSLAALLDGGFPVPLVVTQPDRPVGRHAAPRPSAVAAFAAAHGVRMIKPERIRGDRGLLDRLREAAPDAIAVVAFGRILPPDLLAVPRLGCVNVHASLLPRHRGASPVQAALLAGDRETGVVTMKMEEGLDTGPVFLERRTAIGERETAGELAARLASSGGALLVETLRGLASGTLRPRPQQGEPTWCRTIRREDGAVDWNLDAGSLVRRLRAYTPWPGLHTFLGAERVKILDAAVDRAPGEGEPGTFRVREGRLVAAAGGGTALVLDRLQRAGRTPVTGLEFARALSLPGHFRAVP